MIDDIEAELASTRYITGRERLDPRVLEAIRQVPREAFVPDDLKPAAYANGPLPIGHGQTISQPFIVALMTDLLAPEDGQRILEVGTGSGYQTAVLSGLCRQIYSIEIVPELASEAAERLRRLGRRNIELRLGDGHRGWPEEAPFDGIIVTAAARRLPQALVDQLAPGGRLVIPVGPPHAAQRLVLFEKDTQGEGRHRDILDVAFVPLVEAGTEAPEAAPCPAERPPP